MRNWGSFLIVGWLCGVWSSAWAQSDSPPRTAEQIEEAMGGRRVRALGAIARSWFQQDVTAAAMWVAKSELSDEDKRRILASAGSGR